VDLVLSNIFNDLLRCLRDRVLLNFLILCLLVDLLWLQLLRILQFELEGRLKIVRL
jgi:hypothetical protein